jgi:gamma-glutamyltranspeptidase/glutathione hydrolase
MSPTIILKDGKPVYALGSPGGSSIIPYVAKTIIALIDWKLDIQQAIVAAASDQPVRQTTIWKQARRRSRCRRTLRRWGSRRHEGAELRPARRGDRAGCSLEGGADPRREGVAVGD